MNYTEKIIEIVRNELDVFITPDTEITADTNLMRDLHVDSLDLVVIIDSIEETFGIKINNDELGGIKTVRDIENKIKELEQK